VSTFVDTLLKKFGVPLGQMMGQLNLPPGWRCKPMFTAKCKLSLDRFAAQVLRAMSARAAACSLNRHVMAPERHVVA
jgi:hypothetical protein